MNKLVLVFALLMLRLLAYCQSDQFAGSWEFSYGSNPAVQVRLQIAVPEKGLLYPAQLSVQCDSFTAVYELLLVRKNSRELAISKNKYPRQEAPFSLGHIPTVLTGTLDYSRDLKGQPTLNLKRLQNITVPDTLKTNAANQPTAKALRKLFAEANISLARLNALPWHSPYAERIINPGMSPAYFGLIDTILIPARDGSVSVSSSKNGDVVSASVNGRLMIDLQELGKKPYTEETVLDTGMNIVALFADNFANELPNRGRLELALAKKKITFDFNNRGDSAAGFIVAKLYFGKDKDAETSFENYNPANEQPLKKNEKLLGSVVAVAKQLTLAVWDDAVEDGDSISISINGNWIARGFPVKKNPQTITVTLQPGPNNIVFVGDNVGSIPPNTAVLEIIDGKRRKAFMLQTVPGENNLMRIFYDLR